MTEFSAKGEGCTAFERALVAESCPAGDAAAVWLGLMRRVGVDAILAVMDEFGTEKVHVPTRSAFFGTLWREHRDNEIRRRLMKEPAAVVAADFGLSRQAVYAIRDHDSAADAGCQRGVVKRRR